MASDHHGHGTEGQAHGHNHNKSARSRLLFMLSLTTAFFFVEISVGYITNSMALVADSFHMLSDVVALIIAYVSVRMSPKKWSKNTFGWARAEVLGALVNAVFLCALCFSILVESIKRFYSPEKIHEPLLILVVGVCGLLVNVIGLFLFKGTQKYLTYLQFRAVRKTFTNKLIVEQTSLFCRRRRTSSWTLTWSRSQSFGEREFVGRHAFESGRTVSTK
jgi:Co/Zn/Cd efflux system component